MKRFLLCFLAVSLGAASSLFADNNVSTVQSRLKVAGFYSGPVNGHYDSDTAAAVTRYQIRNGLQINGKLDAPTRQALGVAAGEPEVPLPKFGEDVWRYLRKSDQARINTHIAQDASVPKRTPAPAPIAATPPPVSNPPPASSNHDRLRDYVAAFVLAGLDPQVGAEAEFFADRVDYFGEQNVTREKIRHDLQRYDNRWPQRSFWLAGDFVVVPMKNKIQVSCPLRDELRNGPSRKSGQVWKTLVLEKTGADDLQIVAVNERNAR